MRANSSSTANAPVRVLSDGDNTSAGEAGPGDPGGGQTVTGSDGAAQIGSPAAAAPTRVASAGDGPGTSSSGSGGQTVTAGLPNHAHTMAISPVNLVAEERTLKGSYIGSCVPLRDLPRYIALYRAGKLPVDRLLSDRLRLEDINAGFDRLAEGKAVRQVVVF